MFTRKVRVSRDNFSFIATVDVNDNVKEITAESKSKFVPMPYYCFGNLSEFYNEEFAVIE